MRKLKSIRRFIDYANRIDLVATSLVINWEFRNDLPCGVNKRNLSLLQKKQNQSRRFLCKLAPCRCMDSTPRTALTANVLQN